jgi:hypothetical protein
MRGGQLILGQNDAYDGPAGLEQIKDLAAELGG